MVTSYWLWSHSVYFQKEEVIPYHGFMSCGNRLWGWIKQTLYSQEHALETRVIFHASMFNMPFLHLYW